MTSTGNTALSPAEYLQLHDRCIYFPDLCKIKFLILIEKSNSKYDHLHIYSDISSSFLLSEALTLTDFYLDFYIWKKSLSTIGQKPYFLQRIIILQESTVLGQRVDSVTVCCSECKMA